MRLGFNLQLCTTPRDLAFTALARKFQTGRTKTPKIENIGFCFFFSSVLQKVDLVLLLILEAVRTEKCDDMTWRTENFHRLMKKKTTETTQNNLQHFTRTEAFFIEGRLVTTSASDLKCFTSFVWAHINPHTVYTITPCQILIHFSFTNKPTIYL